MPSGRGQKVYKLRKAAMDHCRSCTTSTYEECIQCEYHKIINFQVQSIEWNGEEKDHEVV